MTLEAAMRFGDPTHSPPDGFLNTANLTLESTILGEWTMRVSKPFKQCFFFGVPLTWGAWQLYLLNRSDDEKRPLDGV